MQKETIAKDVYIPGYLDWTIQGYFRFSYRGREAFTRTRHVIPNYAQLVAANLPLPPLPYDVRHRVWGYANGVYVNRRKVRVGSYGNYSIETYVIQRATGDLWSCNSAQVYFSLSIPIYPTSKISSLASNLYGRLSNKLLNEVKSQKINVAQTFAERQQTVNLITTNAKRLFDALHGLLKHDVKALAALLGRKPKGLRRYMSRYKKDPYKAASSLWLENAYGWTPLLNDIYGAIDVFKDPISIAGSVTVRGTSKDSVYDIAKPYSGCNHRTEMTAQTRQYITVHYGLASDGAIFLKSASALGLTNPALLAWELLPFSFVADWFLPIGNYLSALDATFGLTFHSGCRGDKWSLDSKRSISVDRPFAKSDAEILGGSFDTHETVFASDTYHEEWFDRYILTSFPSAVMPSLKNPLSVHHAANALALLVSLFKR